MEVNACFQTEKGPDYVEIFDGGDFTARNLSRFSGKELPNDVRSTGNQLLVHFTSDSDIQAKGFSAFVKKGMYLLKKIPSYI